MESKDPQLDDYADAEFRGPDPSIVFPLVACLLLPSLPGIALFALYVLLRSVG